MDVMEILSDQWSRGRSDLAYLEHRLSCDYLLIPAAQLPDMRTDRINSPSGLTAMQALI